MHVIEELLILMLLIQPALITGINNLKHHFRKAVFYFMILFQNVDSAIFAALKTTKT